MKTLLQPMLYGTLLLMSLNMFTACSSNQANMENTGSEQQSLSSGSVFGKSTEEKLDEFMIGYVSDLKAAMAEPDDKKTIAMIEEMKEKYTPIAVKLKPEIEAWEKSMSDAEQAAFEKRAEQKSYFKDLFSVGFSSMERINKNPELEKAMADLNSSIDLVEEEEGLMEEEDGSEVEESNEQEAEENEETEENQ